MGLGKDLPLWLQLTLQFINFGLLVFALVYFLKKPLSGYLKKRSASVREKIAEAERLIAEAEGRKALFDKRMAGLASEIEAFKESVRQEMEAEKKKLMDDASALASRIVDQARLAYDQEMKEAMAKIRSEVAGRTIKAAEEMVRSAITRQDHNRMVEEFIKKVRSPN